MRKVADLGWKPVHYVNNVAASVGTVMKPAGFDNVQGILTASYVMDPTDPTWANHPDLAEFKAFIRDFDKAKLTAMGIDPNKVDELFTSERDGKPFKVRYNVGGGKG